MKRPEDVSPDRRDRTVKLPQLGFVEDRTVPLVSVEDETRLLPKVELANRSNIHTRGGLGADGWNRVVTESRHPLSGFIMTYDRAVREGAKQAQTNQEANPFPDTNFTNRKYLDGTMLTELYDKFDGGKKIKSKFEPESDAAIALFLLLESKIAYSAIEFIKDKVRAERLRWNGEQWTQMIEEPEKAETKKGRGKRKQMQVFPAPENETDAAIHRAFLHEQHVCLLDFPPQDLLDYTLQELSLLKGNEFGQKLIQHGYPRTIPKIVIPGKVTKERINYVSNAAQEHYGNPILVEGMPGGILIVEGVRNYNPDMNPHYWEQRKDEILLTGTFPEAK